MIPVRLCDVPADVRRAHVQAAFRLGPRDETAFAELIEATENPSDGLYFVGFDKAPLVEKLTVRQAA